MDTPTFRQRLAVRLEGFPFLRTLLLDTPFLIAMSAASLVVLTAGVSLPKFLQTTPEKFPRATIKVSLLDLAQARSLQRTAARAEAAGDYAAALHSWRAALLNNLGDPALHRGVLGLLERAPRQGPDHLVLGLFSTGWLLALAHTNAADLALSASVLEKHRLSGYALEQIEASSQAEAPEVIPIRARCLMSSGRVAEFHALWEQHRAAWERDPLMQLYFDGWQAGWDSGTAAVEALLRLKGALARPGNEGLSAARLLLIAGARRGVPEDLRLALDRLAEARADSITLHGVYWKYLASVGRLDEALAEMKAFGQRALPSLPHEAAEYGMLLASFNLRTEAIAYLEQAVDRFQTHPAVWEAYLAVLGDARRWTEVRGAAARLRTETASFETARILGLFAEYRAEVADQRSRSADLAADRLVRATILDPVTALRVASELHRDGRSRAALDLLLRKRTEMRDREGYWPLVFAAALELRDQAALDESTQEMLRLAPRNPVALSNRAAMLIVLGERPAEALEITFNLVQQQPQNPAFQINHALALLLNARAEEAWKVLREVRPDRLDRQAASAFHYAETEAHAARGEDQLALESAARVAPGLLLKAQAERFQALVRRLRDRTDSVAPANGR